MFCALSRKGKESTYDVRCTWNRNNRHKTGDRKKLINANWNDAWVGSDRSPLDWCQTCVVRIAAVIERVCLLAGPTAVVRSILRSLMRNVTKWLIQQFNMWCRATLWFINDWSQSCFRLSAFAELISQWNRVTQIAVDWIPYQWNMVPTNSTWNEWILRYIFSRQKC